ncbi:MAG: hypothetical protein IIV55_02295 [Alistipes sp.]|nr:hypothetical protein [Alistipes sp.]
MKRATSIISAFCLGLFISIGILACAVDDYATPNANNPSSDLQLCKTERNYNGGYEHANISYGNDGRISTITIICNDEADGYSEFTNYITYDTNKIKISARENKYIFIFNNELHSYSAETINHQVLHCISWRNIHY